jgi:hypothetical protein
MGVKNFQFREDIMSPRKPFQSKHITQFRYYVLAASGTTAALADLNKLGEEGWILGATLGPTPERTGMVLVMQRMVPRPAEDVVTSLGSSGVPTWDDAPPPPLPSREVPPESGEYLHVGAVVAKKLAPPRTGEFLAIPEPPKRRPALEREGRATHVVGMLARQTMFNPESSSELAARERRAFQANAPVTERKTLMAPVVDVEVQRLLSDIKENL